MNTGPGCSYFTFRPGVSPPPPPPLLYEASYCGVQNTVGDDLRSMGRSIKASTKSQFNKEISSGSQSARLIMYGRVYRCPIMRGKCVR